MRADARRNRDLLIAAAREVFAERGSEGSLDEIAKRAGVGPGTLYRHFPTREDLIDALMRDWADQVDANSDAVVASDLDARTALTTWFDQFFESIGIYRGAAAKLVSAMDDESSPIYGKCQVLVGANEKVLAHIAALGALREGVDARQVMRLVSGAVSVTDESGMDTAQVRPMLDIIIQGILREPDAS
jgi:AcrR family transcriptional regulator